MSDLLQLGLTGLNAYRTALSAVGENVANAETPGFARRSVRLAPAMAGGTTADPTYRDTYQFGGVNAAALQRAWDVFKAAEARHAAAGAGRTDVREQWLTRVETALDDGPAGIGSRMAAFFNAADTLAPKPDDPIGRANMTLALEDLAATFRTTAAALQRIGTNIGTDAQLDTQKLNQTLAALAKVNGTLVTTAAGGTTRAALEDERDRLIDSVAGELDIVTTLADDGTARLELADAPGGTLLERGFTGSLAMTSAADGTLSLTVTTSSGTSAFAPVTGRLAGLIDAAAVTAGRRADLDALASDFAADLNAWATAGRDLAGNPGAPLLSVTAGAASMQSLLTDGAQIPAASAAGVSNGNLLALAGLRGSSGAEQRWTGIVVGHAQQLAAAKSENAAARAWHDNSLAALDETTGIDLDREAADLLRYQQAYSASARIVQVGRETVDAILKLF